MRPDLNLQANPEPSKTKLGGIDMGTPQIRQALYFSFLDGIAANGMTALLETFGIAAAIALRASSMSIALMSSIPMLIGSIGQFLLPAYANPNKGRKYYVVKSVGLQIVFLYLAGLSGWMPEPWRAWTYVSLFILVTLSNNITGPFWVGWMGDLIPSAIRGRHFAWRSIYFSWMYLACAILAGTLSRRYGSENAPWLLFACILFSAGTLRVISYHFLIQQYEPLPSLDSRSGAGNAPESRFEPFRFRPERNFFNYCLATGAFQGAAAMSGPFFAVWYLRDLKFSYLELSIALGAGVLGSIVSAKFWGRLADQIGSAKILRISGLMLCLVPIFFLFLTKSWQIWTICAYSGASWAGYNLANFSYLLHATDQKNRSSYIAFATLVGGLLGCLFTLLGGYLSTRLPVLFRWQLQSLFLLSGIFRLGIFFSQFGKFREFQPRLPHGNGNIDETPGLGSTGTIK